MPRLHALFVTASLLLACRDDDTSVVSGFTSDGDNAHDDGIETVGMGDLRGILTFTLYPADSVLNYDRLGMAGAWYTEEVGYEVVDDFYAAYGLQIAFPLPPEKEDTLEHNDVPGGFNWGDAEGWIRAGNAMKLVEGDKEALACVLDVGMVLDRFPVYAATGSENQPEGCAPDVKDFVPDAYYDLVVYGGEAFSDTVLLEAVHTPAELEVDEPDLEAFELPIEQSEDLRVRWNSTGSKTDRVVIRVWDDFGRMFTIHAKDDGEYAIPSDALSMLTAGPITLTIARERIARIPLDAGGLKAVTRYERWGYLDLR